MIFRAFSRLPFDGLDHNQAGVDIDSVSTSYDQRFLMLVSQTSTAGLGK